MFMVRLAQVAQLALMLAFGVLLYTNSIPTWAGTTCTGLAFITFFILRSADNKVTRMKWELIEAADALRARPVPKPPAVLHPPCPAPAAG